MIGYLEEIPLDTIFNGIPSYSESVASEDEEVLENDNFI